MVPRNNEYLERQSKISDIRGGPSPAQASDAPESNQLNTPFRQNQLSNIPASFKPPPVQTANSQQTTSSSDRIPPPPNNVPANPNAEPRIRRVTVSAHRLKEMDIRAMTNSIKDFKYHSSERAVKLGIVRNSGDMFNKMKADGKSHPHSQIENKNNFFTFFNSPTERKSNKRRLPDRDDEIIQCKKRLNFHYSLVPYLIRSFRFCSFPTEGASSGENCTDDQIHEGRCYEVTSLSPIHTEHGQ